MKIVLKHLHHNPSASLANLIERQLREIGRLLQIDQAHLLLERRLEASPAFRVSAHLVTPGPDVMAEASDHTLRAALQKTMGQLIKRIDHRRTKQARRPSERKTLKSDPKRL